MDGVGTASALKPSIRYEKEGELRGFVSLQEEGVG